MSFYQIRVGFLGSSCVGVRVCVWVMFVLCLCLYTLLNVFFN